MRLCTQGLRTHLITPRTVRTMLDPCWRFFAVCGNSAAFVSPRHVSGTHYHVPVGHERVGIRRSVT